MKKSVVFCFGPTVLQQSLICAMVAILLRGANNHSVSEVNKEGINARLDIFKCNNISVLRCGEEVLLPVLGPGGALYRILRARLAS